MLQSIDHVNIVVTDLDRMVGFYTSVLGLGVTKRTTISGDWIDRTVGLKDVQADVVYLDAPQGPRVELIRYIHPPSPAPQESEPNLLDFRHVAFRVDDIDAAVAKLREAGVEIISEVQAVPDSQVTYSGGVRKRLVYFRDPEGNILELCEYK